MASGRRRRPGSGSWVYKPNKKHPKRIEARFPVPVWAFSKWPGVLQKDGLVKLFPIGFETEATKWLDDNYRAAVQGTWESPKFNENKGKAGRVTFAEYATDYVETRVKANGDPIEETTKEKYRQYLRDHLLPVLGAKAMGDVTDDDIDHWAASMKVGKAGEGAVARRRVFELLRGIFNEAYERPLDASGQTLLKHNPVRHLLNSPVVKPTNTGTLWNEPRNTGDTMLLGTVGPHARIDHPLRADRYRFPCTNHRSHQRRRA
ncbi:hypothetical protein [Bifidobacterium stellenboschense]|uniref:Phage integrase family protein n=1 Tax=Bifidobacterium stellenboschense TaxID=762211 RepID=A0A087DMW2_9BIFI|nr:hypothetical protein [Bifidobacterium stellenboschense]KFI96862.1 phage integrase family protein [Bifidobacterium stellenboschense]